MIDREQIERVLARLRAQADEAEAMAEHARERLARTATQRLDEIDADEVEGAADDLAAAVRKLRIIEVARSEIRSLLT
jgi:hypothetical protein